MFAAYCALHERRVLLAVDAIKAIRRQAAGLAVDFECHCGWHGTACMRGGRQRVDG